MARTRTFLELRGDVASRGDFVITAGGRHTADLIGRYVNESIQAFIRMATLHGHLGPFVKFSRGVTDATSGDGTDVGPNEFIAYPSDAFEILQIQMSDGSSRTLTLVPFSRDEVNQFERVYPTQGSLATGMPAYWRAEGQKNDGTPIIRIIPKSDAVYNFVIEYIPVHADLVDDGDTFDGIAGFEDWVVDEAAQKVLIRDGLAGTPEYQAMEMRKRQTEKDVRQRSSRGRGPSRMFNTRRRRRDLQRYTRFPYRGLP